MKGICLSGEICCSLPADCTGKNKSLKVIQVFYRFESNSNALPIPLTSSVAFVTNTYINQASRAYTCLFHHHHPLMLPFYKFWSFDLGRVNTWVKIPQLLSAKVSVFSSKLLGLWWEKPMYHHLHPHQHSSSPSNSGPWFQSWKQAGVFLIIS